MSDIERARELRNQGIHELRAGNKAEARRLLEEAAQLNPNDEHTWLWLSGALDDPTEQREALEQALEINPASEAAKRGLVKLPTKPPPMTSQRLITAPSTPSAFPKSSPAIKLIALIQKNPIAAWILFLTLASGVIFLVFLSNIATNIELEHLLVQEGDFPARYTLRKEQRIPWELYPGIPHTSDGYFYEIIEGLDQRNEVGHLIVLRYDNQSALDRAYEAMRSEAEFDRETQPLSFGEQGSVTGPSQDFPYSDVLFLLCSTIIHISLNGNTIEQLVTYARRLHDRIIPAIC